MTLKYEIDAAIRKLEKLKEALPEGRNLGSHEVDYPSEYFQHGSWDCTDSPTGNCMYTNHDYDSCIFCYQPDERK